MRAHLGSSLSPNPQNVRKLFEGPMFAKPIAVARGEVVERDGFVFADLLLAS